MKRLHSLALCLAILTPGAVAQSQVVGVYFDFTARHMFSSTTTDFVGDWVGEPGTVPGLYYGIDFDASGTDLYAVNYFTAHIGVLNETTGAFASLGPSGLPTSEIHGLTAHPDGFTWFAIGVVGTTTQLYKGSIGGSWTAVGAPMVGLHLWDIACNSVGELYAESVITDSLYSIDPISGVPTLVGSLGQDLNYAQGFDFDWSDDTLYATLALQLGGGSPDGSRFASIDTATGLATILGDTTPMIAQAEMAIKSGLPCAPTGVPFCDPNELNSTGWPTQLTGCKPGPGESGLHLEAFDGPPGEFGYFLVGTNLNDPGVFISGGRMCLSTAGADEIGRYNVSGTNRNSIGQFDGLGVMNNLVGTSVSGTGFDVPSTVPIPGLPAIMAGETWHFQCWHRDATLGPGSSNFSNGLSVTF